MIKFTKHGIVLTTALILLTSLVTAVPVRVKGSFTNVKGQYIYLYQYFGPELLKIDSVKHTNGQFQFKMKDLMRGFYKIGESEEQSAMVLLGESEITVTADLQQIEQTLVVKDSRENDVYLNYKNFNDKHSAEITQINQKAQAIANEQYSNPQHYNQEITKLQAEMDSLNALQKQFYANVVQQNPDLLVTKFIRMFDFPANLTKDNFFSQSDFSDPEITNGDVLSSKINYYFQRFVTPNLDQWKMASQELLAKIPAGTKNKEVFYISFIKMFLPYDDAYSRTLAKSYNKEYPDSYFAKKILNSLPKGSPEVGDVAPEIKLKDPSGKEVALSSLKGKVVLLDFWASWCGPCRKENPNVVRVYEKYKDKGFTIFSVSLDKSADQWVAAIQQDKLSWNTHVSDLKGWGSSAAALYGVRGIPATFLLDKEGKVVAVNLRGESLEAALKNLLGD